MLVNCNIGGSFIQHLHLATKELDLKGHSGFSDPDKTKDTRENHRRLITLCDRQEQTQDQAKDKRSPRVNPVLAFMRIFRV